MPKEGISLYFSIQDGASNVLTSIGDKTKALDKETQSLAQAQDALRKANEPLISKQAELTKSLDALKEQTKQAKKDWLEYKDELHEDVYDKLLQEQGTVREDLKRVNDQIRENEKTFREYQETLRKGELSESGGALGGGEGSIVGAIIGGQAGQMLAGSLGGLAESLATSALGTPTANLLSDTLSGAIQGAALGTAVAPGVGTVIGAALGGASGFLSGGTKIFEEKDSVFKEYYNGLYESALDSRESTASSGSALAGTRESDLRALTTLLGNGRRAQRFQDSLIEIGRTPPFSYDTAVSLSRDMLGLGLGTKEITDRINSLANAAAALDLSESNVSSIVSALESAQLTGKLETRVARSLSKMGINAYEALGDEFGMSEADVAENLGKMDVERAIRAIYDYMGEHFAGAADGLTDTYEGALGILDSYMEDIKAASGEGYNAVRAEGLQAEINTWSGPLGEAIKEINSLSGQNQAYLENLSEQYTREALNAVLLGWNTTLYSEEEQETLRGMREEFAEAKRVYEEARETYGEGSREAMEASLKMENLRDEAENVAKMAFDSCEATKSLHDAQLDLLTATRDLAAKFDGWSWEYAFGVEQTKGRMASELRGLGGLGGEDVHSSASARSRRELGLGGGNAFGLERVPYDEYPALLHEGERVLTKQEARSQDAEDGRLLLELATVRPAAASPAPPEAPAETPRGGEIRITVTGNSFSGVGTDAAEQVAEVIATRLERAQVAAAPR